MSDTLIDSAIVVLDRLKAAADAKLKDGENWKSPLPVPEARIQAELTERLEGKRNELWQELLRESDEFKQYLQPDQRALFLQNSNFLAPTEVACRGRSCDQILDFITRRNAFICSLSETQRADFEALRSKAGAHAKLGKSIRERNPESSCHKALSASLPGAWAEEAQPLKPKMIERLLNRAFARAGAKACPEGESQRYEFRLNPDDMTMEMFVDPPSGREAASAVTLEMMRELLDKEIRRELGSAENWRRAGDGAYRLSGPPVAFLDWDSGSHVAFEIAFEALCAHLEASPDKSGCNAMISRWHGKELPFVEAAQKHWHEKRDCQCSVALDESQAREVFRQFGVEPTRIVSMGADARGR